MLFISEQIEQPAKIIEEATDDGVKTMYLEGIFMQDTIRNRNGRMYPKRVMQESIRKYQETFIDTKRAMGELNHPTSPQVNPERASHIITSLKEDGNNWIGKAKILSTPMGSLVRNLIEDGVNLGVSSRGLGAVKESNGVNVVQNGYYITAVDVVSDPSAPEAFVNGIMENKEWIIEDGILVEKELETIQEEIEKEIKKLTFKEDKLKEVFQKVLMNI